MNFLIKNSYFLLLIYFTISCVSSKKEAFNSAYKFSSYNYQNSEAVQFEDTTTELPIEGLTASARIEFGEMSENSLSTLKDNIYNKIGLSSTEAESMELVELNQRVSELSQKEKREIRKELKKEVSQYKQEFKDTKAVMETDRVNEISELLRWSIILGSVGLVLLILGAIFTVVLTFFGALFVVGAAVLFVLDQI